MGNRARLKFNNEQLSFLYTRDPRTARACGLQFNVLVLLNEAEIN